MVLAVEIIVCCLIFGIYRVIRIKRDPAYKISNMPEKLQKKVMHMRGYRNRNIRIMTDWEKFVKKLPASFEQASHAFAHRYLVQDSRILDGGYLAQGTEEEHFDIKRVNPKQIDRTRIQEFLKQGDREEVVYFVEEFFRDLSIKALQSNIFRQYITMDAYFCVADFLESLSTDTQDPETPSQDEKTQQASNRA